MKAKFMQVMIVCLVTLAVLSPELIVFNIIWQHHLDFKASHLSQQISKKDFYKFSYSDYNAIPIRKNSVDESFNSRILMLYDKYKILIALESLLLFIPISIGFGVFAHNQYHHHRASIHRKQVEKLEKMWRCNIDKY